MMNKFLSMTAGILAGATLLFAAAPAMARVDVDLNIGVPVYGAPQPVYVQPRPVYVQPQPVYVQPRPVYVHPRPYYGDRHYRHKHYYQRHDRDGDGVPNRYDRRPNNPHRY
jgi:hypothetical protein